MLQGPPAPNEIPDFLHSPLLIWFFLVLGGLNGIAAILEHLADSLPHGLPGWQGVIVGTLRWLLATMQYILECVIAKRSRPTLPPQPEKVQTLKPHGRELCAEYLSHRCPGRFTEDHQDASG